MARLLWQACGTLWQVSSMLNDHHQVGSVHRQLSVPYLPAVGRQFGPVQAGGGKQARAEYRTYSLNVILGLRCCCTAMYSKC
jgi:hypothetical protein